MIDSIYLTEVEHNTVTLRLTLSYCVVLFRISASFFAIMCRSGFLGGGAAGVVVVIPKYPRETYSNKRNFRYMTLS